MSGFAWGLPLPPRPVAPTPPRKGGDKHGRGGLGHKLAQKVIHKLFK